MLRRSVFLLVMMAIAAPLSSPIYIDAAHAKAIERLRCNSSWCEFKERLGKSMTKEFRGVCTYGAMPYPLNMRIRNTDQHTTCTTKCRATAGDSNYITKSCTNWDPVSRDRIKIIVTCGDYPDSSGGLEDTCGAQIAR